MRLSTRANMKGLTGQVPQFDRDTGIRGFMESRFGHDFSGVRASLAKGKYVHNHHSTKNP